MMRLLCSVIDFVEFFEMSVLAADLWWPVICIVLMCSCLQVLQRFDESTACDAAMARSKCEDDLPLFLANFAHFVDAKNSTAFLRTCTMSAPLRHRVAIFLEAL